MLNAELARLCRKDRVSANIPTNQPQPPATPRNQYCATVEGNPTRERANEERGTNREVEAPRGASRSLTNPLGQ